MALPAQSGQLGQGAIFGHYEVVRLLGSGGMGSVYEALHVNLGKRFALKTLLPQYASNPEVRSRFLREGKLAAKLRHPHVVDVTDFGVEGDVPYLVMEFLEGEDLAGLIKREGRLSAEQTADVLLPITAALASAHDQQIVHRDLKPQNIFLAVSETGETVPKLLDFGISKLLSGPEAAQLTGTMNLLGTPAYMSPEQTKSGKHVDARSDQYTLAVIAYECVTGQVPFQAESVYEVMRMIVEGHFLRPSELAPDLSPEMEALILQGMQNKADDRFPSTWTFGAGLLPLASARTRMLWEAPFQRQESTYVGPTPARTASSEHPARFVTSPGPDGKPVPPDSVRATTPAPLSPPGANDVWNPTPIVEPTTESPAFRRAPGRQRTGPRRALSSSAVPALGAPVAALAAKSNPVAPLASRETQLKADLHPSDSNLTSQALRAAGIKTGGPLKAVLVGAVVVLGGLCAWWLLEPKPESASESPPSAPVPLAHAAPVVPPPTVPPVPPQTYQVDVTTLPSDAAVLLDGEAAGRGQVQRTLPVDGKSHTLEIHAEGYVAQTIPFKDQPPLRFVELQKNAPAPPPVTVSSGHTVESGGRGSGHKALAGTLRAGGDANRTLRLAHPQGEAVLGSVGGFKITLQYRVAGGQLIAHLMSDPAARVSVDNGSRDSTKNGPVALPPLGEHPVTLELEHRDLPTAHLTLSFEGPPGG